MAGKLSLYLITVPLLINNLKTLEGFLKKGEQWAKDNGKSPSALVEAKLADDMLPLSFQIRMCTMLGYLVVTKIAGEEFEIPQDSPGSFEEMYTRIEKVLGRLEALKPEAINGKEGNEISLQMGSGEKKWEDILQFWFDFATPNFFFHKTTAYNILRHTGVPLGKKDFL